MSQDDSSKIFNELIGTQLSSVEFVQDYLQLRFDGPTINVTNPLTVKTDQKTIVSWNNGFRDLLCEQITKIVDRIDIEPEKQFKITFADRSEITISLRPEDFDSPEAVYAHGFKNNRWVVY